MKIFEVISSKSIVTKKKFMAKLLNEDASKAVVPNLVAAKHKVDVSWAQSYETFMHLYKRLPLSD